jgi:VIT1/CCC1 family predicted Fe2+/Mn2+ transporter
LSNVLGDYLDPIDSLFSILYSVLFALVFTLSYEILIYRGGTESGFSSGYGQRLALVTLGAVTGWGIIEGAAYLLGSVLARSERHRLLRAVQASSSDEEAVSTVADELDFILEPITSDEQRNALYHDMLGYLRHAEPRAAGFQREDVVGALTVVLLYIVAVLPSMLPLFLVPDNFPLAIRVSNVVSLLVVFATGYTWGTHTDTNPWKTGLLLASACLAMVVVSMLLGG